MHCFRCKSIMAETDRQTEGRSQVVWYLCPVCSNEQLHAQRTTDRQYASRLDRAPTKTIRAYGGR